MWIEGGKLFWVVQVVRNTVLHQSSTRLRDQRPTNHDHDVFPADHETVTFVGRPFPLEEAHEHFSRLRRWGFSFSARSFVILKHDVLKFYQYVSS